MRLLPSEKLNICLFRGIYILDSLSNGHPTDVFERLRGYVAAEFKRATQRPMSMEWYKNFTVKVGDPISILL
jgi:Ulp1 family protease